MVLYLGHAQACIRMMYGMHAWVGAYVKTLMCRLY